jgi:hypothetical protein
MKKPFPVVTWNLHHAKVSSLAWDYLLELNPDIALLQEVGIVPEKISSRFSQYASLAIKKMARRSILKLQYSLKET